MAGKRRTVDVDARDHILLKAAAQIVRDRDIARLIKRDLGRQYEQKRQEVGKTVAPRGRAADGSQVPELHTDDMPERLLHGTARIGLQFLVLFELAQRRHGTDLPAGLIFRDGVKVQGGKIDQCVEGAALHLHPLHAADDAAALPPVQSVSFFKRGSQYVIFCSKHDSPCAARGGTYNNENFFRSMRRNHTPKDAGTQEERAGKC